MMQHPHRRESLHTRLSTPIARRWQIRPISGVRPFLSARIVPTLFMIIATAVAAEAAGSNTTQPPAQPTPPPLSPQTYPTNFPSTSNVGSAVCSSQLNDLNTGLQASSIATSIAANTIGSIGSSAAATALLSEIILANPSPAVGEYLNAAAFITNLASDSLAAAALGISVTQNNLPFCDGQFMGTISSVVNPLTGLYGGANISGNSIFNDSLGIVGNLYTGGNISAAQLFMSQGISALGGGIFIGDPNGVIRAGSRSAAEPCRGQASAARKPIPATQPQLPSATTRRRCRLAL